MLVQECKDNLNDFRHFSPEVVRSPPVLTVELCDKNWFRRAVSGFRHRPRPSVAEVPSSVREECVAGTSSVGARPGCPAAPFQINWFPFWSRCSINSHCENSPLDGCPIYRQRFFDKLIGKTSTTFFIGASPDQECLGHRGRVVVIGEPRLSIVTFTRNIVSIISNAGGCMSSITIPNYRMS